MQPQQLTPAQVNDYYTSQSASKTPLSPAQYLASLSSATPSPATPPATPPTNPAKPDVNAGAQTITAPPGGAQPGADVTKQGQAGYDVFGNKVGTTTPAPATGTSNGTTGTDPNAPALSDQTDRAALAQANAEYQTTAKTALDTITGIQNGSVPLTAGEQAQIDGLKSQFQTLIDAQNLQNTGAFGVAQMRGYQGGAAEYDPTFQAKTIGSVVAAGAAKVSDLMVKEASAVATLTQSFKDNDIKAVKDAWTMYQDASKARTDALQKTIDDTQAAIKDALDAKQKADTYNLDVEKFQQTKDQNAFDNALKTEQEAFDEKYKTETYKLDAFKAGMGAGGGSVGVGTSAQIGPSGAPDPASQKQVLDQITAKYGPMTAVAIKSLADYTMNPTDWSTRNAKGMSREEAVTLAKMYDPTYNDAMYTTRAGYMKSIASTASGTVGGSVNSANKSINHLTAFVNSMSQLNNGWTSTGNALKNSTVTQLFPQKRTAMMEAQTEGMGVADEMAKFFKGTGATDVGSIEAWRSQLSTNASPADVAGLTQGAINLLEGQLETLSEQYAQTMGRPPETGFLGPSASANLSNLKNEGYIVNIPGVNYTDKDAYVKYDPDAQANMQSAVKQLTAAGLPLTPDNILQLAQAQ